MQDILRPRQVLPGAAEAREKDPAHMSPGHFGSRILHFRRLDCVVKRVRGLDDAESTKRKGR